MDKAVKRNKGQTSRINPIRGSGRPGNPLTNMAEDIATTLNIGKLGKNNRKIMKMTGRNLKGKNETRLRNT